MLGKPLSGDPPAAAAAAAAAAAGDSSSADFLHEIQSLSRALSLAQPQPNKPPSPNPNPKKKKEKKPSFWPSWKSLKPKSNRRLDCLFSLHVHSITSLPSSLSSSPLSVHWRRAADPPASSAATLPSTPFDGAADFDETLTRRCSVHASRGSGGSASAAKYEPRQFVISVSAAEVPGADLGKHVVDLTRLLPLTLEELDEEEKRSGRWSTGFRLSGKGKGAFLNVSFGFSLVEDGSLESIIGGEKKVSEVLSPKERLRSRDRSRSVEDVKVLHEVLPKPRSEVEFLTSVVGELEYGKYEDSPKSKRPPEFEIFVDQDFLPDSKLETVKENAQKEGEVPEFTVVEDGEKEVEVPEFTVVEQGIEIATEEEVCEVRVEKIEIETNGADEVDEMGWEEGGQKPYEAVKAAEETSHDSHVLEDSEDLDSVFCNLSILGSEGFKSPHIESKTSTGLSSPEFKVDYGIGSMKSKTLCFDDATEESVASEFLSMLGIEHSPLGLSSDSDSESPRERLWKQFEKETLTGSNLLFGIEGEEGRETNWGNFSEQFDLSLIVHEAELELNEETQASESRSRAKMLEDAETEALMREYGLNEKAFQCSPPGSRGGFGSPIDLPPEEPMELPPLGEGLGPFVQTKDGGFLRSMSPSLFKNARNNGNLLMQVSSPVVVPAEMGSGIMEILQRLASVGIEKLSMQAKKLMPLEDITGKTMQQIAWESSPSLEACDSHNLLQHLASEADPGLVLSASSKSRKSKRLKPALSSGGEMASEYVALEDLAPSAMDKIEALSIEGLRIQSGMSDEDAPSNISPQSIGDISALEGKGAMSSRSLGLEGTAGLQLLNVKDSGDDVGGLMGLSITLDEWMRLDSGILDEEEHISDKTSKILAAHHARSMDLTSGGYKGDNRGGKKSGRRWGLLGNNFTVALMVQLRDPLRNYEPVGTPMLSLIQVERVFLPPKPKIYTSVSEKGNNEEYDDGEAKPLPLAQQQEKKEEEDAIPQFKITEVHVAGLKTEPGKKKPWGNSVQQQSGSRWLLATGMGKSTKHPFMKAKAVSKPSQATTKVQPGDTLWSISSRVHGTGAKWKELLDLNPHIRNPNVIFPNETIRLR